jgi:YaiO family outer membrane protein
MMHLTLTVTLALAPLCVLAAAQDRATLEAEARMAVEDGRIEDALTAYETLILMAEGRNEYRIWSARLSRWLGDPGGALGYLAPVLSDDPDNLEAGLEMAYVFMLQQRFAETWELLAQMVARAGENVDVLMALARLSRYQGDNGAAADYVERVLVTDPEHAEALELERALAAALETEPLHSVTLGYGHDRFTFADAGHSASLTVSYLGDRSRLDFLAEAWDKFATRTQRIGPSVSHRFGERLWIRGSALWARHAEVLPRQTIGGGISWALPGGWVVSGDYRQLRFQDPLVHVASPSFEYYFEHPGWVRISAHRSWTHYRTTTTPNTTENAFDVRYSRQLGSRFVGTLGYARGNESYRDLSIDRVGSVEANTYMLGVTANLSRRLSTRVSYSHRQSSGGNDQDGIDFSLTLVR